MPVLLKIYDMTPYWLGFFPKLHCMTPKKWQQWNLNLPRIVIKKSKSPCTIGTVIFQTAPYVFLSKLLSTPCNVDSEIWKYTPYETGWPSIPKIFYWCMCAKDWHENETLEYSGDTGGQPTSTGGPENILVMTSPINFSSEYITDCQVSPVSLFSLSRF